MKTHTLLLSSLLGVGILSAALVGCAGSDEGTDPSGESNLTAGSSTSGSSTSGSPGSSTSGSPEGSSSSGSLPVDGIAACAGRRTCVNMFVVKTLLNSQLELTGEIFQNEENPITDAGEFVISWIQGRSKLAIEPSPLGGGKYRVKVTVADSDDTGESSCSFTFTLDHDKIVESKAPGECAG